MSDWDCWLKPSKSPALEVEFVSSAIDAAAQVLKTPRDAWAQLGITTSFCVLKA